MPPTRPSLWIAAFALALLFLAAHTGSAHAETAVGSGTLTANTTWTAAGSPYIVGQVYIGAGVTLTIEPGVEVRFTTDSWISPREGATLIAEGTAANPIVFTSHAGSPAPGDWRYLYFYPGSTVRLRYCDVAYAGRHDHAGVEVYSSDVQISNCRIHDHLADAVLLSGVGLTPTLANLQIDANSGRAVVQSTPDMAPSYTGLTLTGNGVNAVVIPSGTIARTMTLDGSPAALGGAPLILGQVYVAAPNALIITPGTTIAFAADGWISPREGATLVAEGTETAPIVFGSAAAPGAPGDWRYLYFYPGSTVRLRHCDIAYAGRHGHAGVEVYSSDVQISNCRIHDNGARGIWIAGVGINPQLAHVTIENNTGAAVEQGTVDMTPLYANLTLHGNGKDGVVLPGGTLQRAYTLDGSPAALNGSPYFLGQVYVATGVALTLTAGTELRFSTDGFLAVREGGVLTALGTGDAPVRFVSDAVTPAPGDWRYLYFYPGARGFLSGCIITHAGRHDHAALEIYSSSVVVSACRIYQNLATGVVARQANPTLQANSIYSNAFGLRNESPQQWIDARDSWWGHYRGPNHPVLNPYGRGNGVSDGVLFDPWSTADSLDEDATSLTLRALDAISQTTASNSGPSTFLLMGIGFVPDVTATLTRPDGQAVTPSGLHYLTANEVLVTFNLDGQPAGAYDISVTWPDGEQRALQDTLTVAAGLGGHVWTRLQAPQTIRLGRPFLFSLEYGNDGDADIAAPWVTLEVAPSLRWQLLDGDPIAGRHLDVMALSEEGPAGILRPGQSASLTFSATWTTAAEQPVIRSWLAESQQMIPPARMVELAGYDPAQAPWDIVVQQLAAQFTNDFATYTATLADLATEASQIGSLYFRVEDLVAHAALKTYSAMLPSAGPLPAVSNLPAAATELCHEPHDEFDTDSSTWGIGSRTGPPFYRWVPWKDGHEPTAFEIAWYMTKADFFKTATYPFFMSTVVAEWIDHYMAGSGETWTATYEHPASQRARDYILGSPGLRGEFEEDFFNYQERAILGEIDPPYGISVLHEPARWAFVDFARGQDPALLNPIWNHGVAKVWVGRTPSLNEVGWETEFTRLPNDKVLWVARNVPIRIEDTFQIWESKVNAACRKGGKLCRSYKGDSHSLFLWAYMVDVFGPARCFHWNNNIVVPVWVGEFWMTGVEADAGGDQTVMVPEGQSFVPVTLNGGVKHLARAKLMEPNDPSGVPPFDWSGLPVAPPDVQRPTVNLQPGTYVFQLQVNARSEFSPTRIVSDTDSITVRVLPHDPDDEKKPRGVTSWDPNDKLAPQGAGVTNAVAPGAALPYTIRFENDPAHATAPAQDVFITDELDDNLDWSTVELVAFGFGNRVYTIPPGKKFYSTTVDLTGEGINLLVDLDVSLDAASGVLRWRFTSIDPSTGQPLLDPLAGFLPPNDATGRGEGFVSFVVSPKSNLASSVTIRNRASIVFDANPAILTPETSNGIDPLPPDSSVQPLPAQSASIFTVRWSGADDPDGSGIAVYDVYVSENEGPYRLWLAHVSATSEDFSGTVGSTYRFISLATDAVGNRQTSLASPAVTTVTTLARQSLYLPLVAR